MRKTLRREIKELGELRTSQLITSFGVGAIIDFKEETAILAAADDWYTGTDRDTPRVLRCHNLENILHKQFFVKPACDPKNRAMFKRSYSHDIGAYRFPSVLYCPNCARLLHERRLAGMQKGELRCPFCTNRLVPSRFVVICRRGHIDDFPYDAWVHRGDTCSARELGTPQDLRLFNINGRTNLGSLMVRCEACKSIRSMQEAFVPSALKAIYRCAGRQPWLDHDDCIPCVEQPVVRMRSSTGVYMAVNISALNIPPWSSNICRVLLNHLDALEGKSEESARQYIKKRICAALPGVDPERVLSVYRLLTDESTRSHPDSPKELYEEEYCALREPSEDEGSDFCSRRMAVPNAYGSLIRCVMAIDRLTEIVSMVGFTRLQGWNGDLESPCLAPVFSHGPKEWLPAIDMHGEGLFIELKEDVVLAWELKNRAVYQPMLQRAAENRIHCENASPRYVLLHTLAHLLIRSLAKQCGYQMTSLKERVYATYENGLPMAGILIYTASSDAEGSLGGLVAQADPAHISEHLNALLEDASWCSGDPLCMSSSGDNAQGLNGLNYAACHQCTLLPETSCVMRNLLLDRAALIGHPEDGTVGYFSDIE